MKKIFLSIVLSAGIILGMSNAVLAEQKVAVVDIPAVVAQSKEVKALKKEQQAKIRELEKWLAGVKADVQKQQTPEEKEKLIQTSYAEFTKKKELIAKDYAARLQAVDKSISEAIATQAKLKGYDMVVSKNIVIYGGDDITADVKKAVK